MKSAFVWHYGAVIARVEYSHQICVVDLRGPVTRRALERVRLDMVRHAVDQVRAFVVDLTGAVVGVDAEEMLELEVTDQFVGVIKVPIAFVMPKISVAMFREFARAAAEKGLLRIPTLTRTQALEWSLRRAVVDEWAADLRASGLTGVALAQLNVAAGVNSAGRSQRPNA